MPLLIYGLVYGPLESNRAAAEVQILQWVLLLVTFFVLGLFLFFKHIGRLHAWTLLGVYMLWMSFVVRRGTNADWTRPLAEFVQELHQPVTITKAEYDQIEKGMSVEDVLGIIGEGCSEMTNNQELELPNGLTLSMSVYSCVNVFGSNALFTFQNDSLVIKVQVGL